MSDRSRMTSVLHLAGTVALAAAPFFVTDFAGFRSNQFPVPLDNPPMQPAGYAFSIWLVIYLWLIGGAVFGLIKRADSPDWTAMRVPLIISLIASTVWLPVATMSVLLSTIIIWIALAFALLAVLRAGHTDALWQRGPVGLYAGWLTAASSVSIGLLLAGFGVTGAQTAALLSILIALVIAVGMLRRRADTPSFAVGLIWALVAVIVQNLSPMLPLVIGFSVVGILVIGGLAWRGTTQA